MRAPLALRVLALFATAALVAGAAGSGPAGSGSGPGSDGRAKKERAKKKKSGQDAAAQDQFSGLFEPLTATDMRAPEGGFRISGWTSWGGPLKLMELAPDGQEVKQGDVVARFEFNARDALTWIRERQQRALADRSQARILSEQTLDGLRVEMRRLQLQAELAALDLQKERAISRRQAELYRIAEKIARFEADSVTRRLTSAERAQAAELAFHDQSVARTEQDLQRYEMYERRYVLRAPHDGVVRHAYNPRERRKVQKGDNIMSGQKLVSVAKDPKLAVRFFVPEHRIFELQAGMQVTVASAHSGEELAATVKRVDFFPQELGFLRELPNLPNAREKAFSVLAELDEVAPPTLSAGTEVRVKVRKR